MQLRNVSYVSPKWNYDKPTFTSASASKRQEKLCYTLVWIFVRCPIAKALEPCRNAIGSHVIQDNGSLPMEICTNILSRIRGSAWLIRRVFNLMFEFIGPLCNWLQQFTNQVFSTLSSSSSGHSRLLTTLEYSTTPLYSAAKVKVEVALQLAVYCLSVRLGVKPLETHDQRSFFQLSPCGNSPSVTSSLTSGCVSLMSMLYLPSSLGITLLVYCWKFFLLHCIQVLCQYRLGKAGHAYLTYLMLKWQLSHLNGRKLNHRQV
jgi:hypothetical protein